ncbi:MAG TPA: dTMP kinase, partial [Clostridium sp.]|nr:dTMP kinase [Clostridium sp.]
GRGLGEIVAEVNRIATGGISPDITFFLELSPETGISRKKSEENHEMDRLEQEKQEFHHRVYNGYKTLSNLEGQRICPIDASEGIEAV